MTFSFHVSGLPETKGSWRGIGGGRMKADNPREKAWAETVGWAAKAAILRAKHVADKRRYAVTLTFVLSPPSGRKNKRDLDKLIRSVLDALTGLIWCDDEQVDEVSATKRVTIGAPIGVTVEIAPIE